MRVFYLLFLFTGIFLDAKSIFTEEFYQLTCGYDSCPRSDPKKLNVHLLPFTLNKVGYSSSESTFYKTHAKYQINSVVDSLAKDPARRFTYTDVIFLWKWWQNQNDSRRDALKLLINEGRFEIANGGWTPNDEAVPHYQSIIDQYTWGFRRLNDTFGSCARPRVGWQINSYAHSREQASIFAQMGFDGAYVFHVDPAEKFVRHGTKTGELIWETSHSRGKSTSLFTSILTWQDTPKLFCYDVRCPSRIPIVEDPTDINYNVNLRATSLMTMLKDQAKKYKTNDIIFLLGGLNHYVVSELWYSNFDKLIKYIHENKGTLFNLFYSTPSCYLKSLNEKNLTWPVKTQDFIPHASDLHSYHTGYYSSKPSIKFFERQANNFLQVVKQLSVLSSQPDSKELQYYREAMASMQSIHGVTGNHISHTGSRFTRILHESMENAQHLAYKALHKLTSKKESTKRPEIHSCLSLNISACNHTSENKKFVVTVYNPTSQPLCTFVRLPVNKGTYEVKDYSGADVVTQIIPIPESVLKIPGRLSSATMELIFKANNVSALGYKSYFVQQKSEEAPDTQPSTEQVIAIKDQCKIGYNLNSRISMSCSKFAKSFDMQQTFRYYESAKGYQNTQNKASSNLLVFRPKNNETKELEGANFQVYQGPLVSEIHQVVNDWVSQVVRVYSDTEHVEFNWLIGPIPIENGKEVITRYTSNLKNQHEFYTDSNGRGRIHRKLKNLKSRYTEPVSANYYPIASKIAIVEKSAKTSMSVLVDRTEGGSSLADGELELMLHRRVMTLDQAGISAPVNEIAFGTGLVVRGKHYLLVNKLSDESIMKEKEMAVQLSDGPWLFFTPVHAESTFEEWREDFKMKSRGAIKSLPRHVRILTLEPWKEGEILLRLENLLGKNANLAEVNLKELFNDFTLLSARETSLGANQWLKDVHRLKWQADSTLRDNTTTESGSTSDTFRSRPMTPEDSLIVQLRPMEIRTFILKIAHKAAL